MIRVWAPILTALIPLIAMAAPSDPYFPLQWSLNNDGTQSIPIDADPLHTIMQKGASGADIGWLAAQAEISKLKASPVTVAVIDTGVDPSHPDLAGRLAPDGFDFIKAPQDVQNKIPNNTANMSDEPDSGNPNQKSDAGHGTNVSGIIAAKTDNAAGIAGIAPSSVKILPLRILSDQYGEGNNQPFTFDGKLISDYAADAINYAVAHGASIINMSLGWPKIVDTQNARQAVQDAIAKGVLIVAAAGNDRKDLPTYPCAYNGVICVGAITNTGAMSLYSNLGGMVDVLAPGDYIVSTFPMDLQSPILRIQGYEAMSGTSMASPEVAAVAASLKAVMPGISLQELEARLLISGAPLPSETAPGLSGTNPALYGTVNLKRALDALPQPVFLPDFKSIDSVTVDEASLQTQGQVSVENLWAPATGVEAEITVNGVSAGTAQIASLAQGASLVVPWRYKFPSLDDSSLVHLSLRITDAAGDSRVFSSEIPAARAMDKIAGSKVFNVPAAVPGGTLIGQNVGQFYTNLSVVGTYPAQPGMPEYFMQHRNPQGLPDYGPPGCLLNLIDPSSANPVQTIPVPGIQRVIQVLRLNENPSTKATNDPAGMDWVIIGLGNLQSKTGVYYEFYFLNSKLQPLWGSDTASAWVIGLNNGLGTNIIRDYTVPGSWVLSGNELVPAFITQTTLPAQDNFDGFDLRHYQSDDHLIYLLPQPASANNPTQLVPRALDGATFRKQFATNPILKAIVPPNPADAAEGHLRALISLGMDEDAQTILWDIPSVASTTTSPAPGWDQNSSSGVPVLAISTPATGGSAQNQSAYLNFFDGARGSLAWATSQGQYLDRTEFSYPNVNNPITGLIGAFNLPSLGRVWFMQSQFDLIAYRQAAATGDAGITTQTLPIDRDSTFPDEDFSRMFTPVVVGTSATPLPGVYIDSTVVRGNLVSVAVLQSGHTSDGLLEKPLRYSLEIPPSCLQLNPVHLTASPESFALPMLCLQSGANQAQFEIVSP